jgi:RimJ/RimL family protein N-acetyltransferase
MQQMPLHTERIALVPLDDAHLEHEVELDTEFEVMRYISGRAQTRDEVVQVHGHRVVTAQLVPGLGWWAGFVDGSFVGLWLLKPPKRAEQGPVGGQGELGYRLLPRWWRQGLAREGAHELVRYGFEDVGLARIFAETLVQNERSRTVMSAVGMRCVGGFHRAFVGDPSGREQGAVVYAISRAEWVDRRADR